MTRGEKIKVQNQKRLLEKDREEYDLEGKWAFYYEGWIDALDWVLYYLRYNITDG